MRILHVINGLNVGGAEVMLAELLEQFKVQDDIDCAVVSLKDIGEIGERLQENGIEVQALDMISGVPDIRGYFKLRRIASNFKPDLIQTWLQHADLLGGLVGKSLGVPVVWGIHFSLASLGNTKWLHRVIAHLCMLWAEDLSAAVISCAHSSSADHIKAGYPKALIQTIPNGVSTQRFRPNNGARVALRQALDISDSCTVIGMVARYHPLKNHRLFLKAAARLREALPEVRFILCGSGVDQENRELVGLIERWGLADHIELLGVEWQMPQVYAGLDILTLCSDSEAMPIVLAEAMSCGVPCVATDVGDCKALMGGLGAIVPSRPRALVEGWVSVLEELERGAERLREEVRERICADFSIEQSAERYLRVYREVLSKSEPIVRTS